ncbi:guanylate kinase [Alphaproteobacteria bacterium]|nr:guanylate kinase [Alphaproteobacteria bacterium]
MLNNIRRGLVLVISSPSGAGKTTICKKIINEINGVALSVSATTRKKRKNEIHGKDYFFKSDQEFSAMLNNKEFIETANVFGYSYGTLNKEVLSKIEKGIDVIVDIDWQGTRQIEKHLGQDVVKVFILPPSIKELEIRLGNRASEDKENFLKRMSEARKEISHYKEYDFIIINNEIDVAFSDVKSILYSERLKRFRQIKLDQIIDKSFIKV